MAQMNIDPHTEGYVFDPLRTVTAFFDPGANLTGVAAGLREAGFRGAEVNVFSGKEGASKLDLSGEKHGPWTHLMRQLESVFADQVEQYAQADALLRAGGSVVVVATGGDEKRKTAATMALKAHGGREIFYWGVLTTDQLA
jgi:hypothetical protein